MEDERPVVALRPTDGDDMVLRGALEPEEGLAELVENCGAGRTSANPVLATWWFRWLRFAIEPRGIPKPAEPAFRTRCDGVNVETVPPFPTETVLTVPVAGATGGRKLTGNVPA